jgi:hypothetical protein
MPVSKPADLPAGGGGRWPHLAGGWRSATWGDLEVGYTTTDPIDCTPVYAGLPGGVCPCPHYGYVFAGRLRCVYVGTDWPEEVAEAGDVYFFQPGHVLIYDEPSEVLEFNPASTLKLLMDHIEGLAGGHQLDDVYDGDGDGDTPA